MKILKQLCTAILLGATVTTVSLAQEPIYIDVRSWAEHQLDGIDADVQIHYPDIAEQISAHVNNKDQEIYVYCAKGGRAEQARTTLIGAGYTNVTNLGGISDVRALRGLE